MKNNEWKKEEIEYLKNNYLKQTNRQLALNLDRSIKAVEIKLTRLGFTRPKKLFYDDTIFETINSEEKAYWLGFLMADGYITTTERNAELGIELNIKDKEHLVKFQKFLKTNAMVQERNRFFEKVANNYCNKTLNSCFIRIYNKKIVEDLMKLGFQQNNRSKGLEFCDMPPILRKHFIRGFFDGDGSIYQDHKRKTLRCNITSSDEDFLKKIRSVLYESSINSYITNWTNGYNHKMYQLNISAKKDVEKYLDFIYKDSKIYLERKYSLYLIATSTSNS